MVLKDFVLKYIIENRYNHLILHDVLREIQDKKMIIFWII